MLLGDLRVDLGARRVTREGVELNLGKLSFDLLEALVRAAPAALSNDEIVARVWSGDAVTDENIKQRVSLLRRALAGESDREYVETLRGFGYRLADEPRPLSRDAAPAAGTAGQPVPARSERLARTLILILAIVSLLLLIAVLAIAVRQLKRTRVGALPDADPAQEAPIAARPGYGALSRSATDTSSASSAGSSTRPAASRGVIHSRPRNSSGQWSSTSSTSMVNTSTVQVPPHLRYS